MPKFSREWTFRTPAVTVTYPAGWEGRLSKERYDAARAAGAFRPVPPAAETTEPEKSDGDDVHGQPVGGEGRSGEAEGG